MFNSIGVIGLGVMGSNIALNMANKGENVAVYNYTRDLTDQLIQKLDGQSLSPYYELEDFVQSLEKPRKIFLMVTAGKPVDSVIQSLKPLLEEGDVIMDGGNSHYEDTERRYDELKEKGIGYLGVGISGGEVGALTGPSIMPGGDRDVYEKAAPILTKIAAQVGDDPCCVYIGPKGAGHFTKMVHNGIEYADMQLIAEASFWCTDRYTGHLYKHRFYHSVFGCLSYSGSERNRLDTSLPQLPCRIMGIRLSRDSDFVIRILCSNWKLLLWRNQYRLFEQKQKTDFCLPYRRAGNDRVWLCCQSPARLGSC